MLYICVTATKLIATTDMTADNRNSSANLLQYQVMDKQPP